MTCFKSTDPDVRVDHGACTLAYLVDTIYPDDKIPAEHEDWHVGFSRIFARWSPVLLVIGVSLFHAINNWIWLTKNVMTRGWDRIGALVNSLFYHQTLANPSLQAIFQATIQDEIRPPLFAFSMAIMYKLFGVSPDVAVMVNVLYLVILVAASYGIGFKLGDRRTGMLSAVLVALIPLLFAMSRYSYFEFSLAAFTALSIFSLLASERFEKRGFSLLLGLAMGFGALTKRTFPLFVVGALVVAFFQAGLPRRIWSRLRAGPRVQWQDVGVAVAGGLALSALWYLPNRDAAQALPAGAWLFPIWWVLAAVAIYFMRQPSSPETNFMSCFALGALLASVWYVPRLDFVERALRTGWGVDDPRGRTVDFTSLGTYLYYLRSIIQGLSLSYLGLLLLSAGLLLIHRIQQRLRLRPDRWLKSDWWLIIGSLIGAYALLTTSIYKEQRAITPLLPFIGITLAVTLRKLPWQRLRASLIAFAVVLGLIQFFAVSYTQAHWLVEETSFRLPLLGQSGLFAQGPYQETPDSGLNDPDFWIAGDVLERVEATRQRERWDAISLGIVAYSSHVHVGMFAYDLILHYPAIQLEDPAQVHPQTSAYWTAFRYDYVLVLRDGNRRPAVREAASLILEERRSFFEKAFQEEQRYLLPDGSQVYLFRRRYRPSQVHAASSLYEVAEYLQQTVVGEDVVVAHPTGLLTELLQYYWGPAPISILADAKALDRHPRVFAVTDQNGRAQVEAWVVEQVQRDQPPGALQFGELWLIISEGPAP